MGSASLGNSSWGRVLCFHIHRVGFEGTDPLVHVYLLQESEGLDLWDTVLVRISGRYIVCFIFGIKLDCGPLMHL